MKSGSRRISSDRRGGLARRSREHSSREGGFTLLEVTIAMTFVTVLIGGITLSISTCLKVWERSRETADLNQEARAIIEVVSRDIRGAYLGLHRDGGYFLASSEPEPGAAGPALEFTTESSTLTRAALSPANAAGQAGPPATDFVAVRYELLRAGSAERSGLYRTSWVSPSADWLEQAPSMNDAVGLELISDAVVGVRFRYYDGGNWLDGWATTRTDVRLPQAVAVQLSILDARANEHVYESIISVPTS